MKKMKMKLKRKVINVVEIKNKCIIILLNYLLIFII